LSQEPGQRGKFDLPMRFPFLLGLKCIVCIKINAVKIHTQDLFMRLVAQVADSGSFFTEPSLAIITSILFWAMTKQCIFLR